MTSPCGFFFNLKIHFNPIGLQLGGEVTNSQVSFLSIANISSLIALIHTSSQVASAYESGSSLERRWASSSWVIGEVSEYRSVSDLYLGECMSLEALDEEVTSVEASSSSSDS